MGRWMINCEEYTKLVSQCMDTPPSLWTRVLIKVHQLICPPCGFLKQQLDDIRSACRWAPAQESDPSDPGETLPEEARARIKSALKDISR